MNIGRVVRSVLNWVKCVLVNSLIRAKCVFISILNNLRRNKVVYLISLALSTWYTIIFNVKVELKPPTTIPSIYLILWDIGWVFAILFMWIRSSSNISIPVKIIVLFTSITSFSYLTKIVFFPNLGI